MYHAQTRNMPRKDDLLELLKLQETATLIFKQEGVHMSIAVPKMDLNDRGHFVRNQSLADNLRIKKSINESILKFLSMPEAEKQKEDNVCNFAQDISLLWHFGDIRVTRQ